MAGPACGLPQLTYLLRSAAGNADIYQACSCSSKLPPRAASMHLLHLCPALFYAHNCTRINFVQPCSMSGSRACGRLQPAMLLRRRGSTCTSSVQPCSAAMCMAVFPSSALLREESPRASRTRTSSI